MFKSQFFFKIKWWNHSQQTSHCFLSLIFYNLDVFLSFIICFVYQGHILFSECLLCLFLCGFLCLLYVIQILFGCDCVINFGTLFLDLLSSFLCIFSCILCHFFGSRGIFSCSFVMFMVGYGLMSVIIGLLSFLNNFVVFFLMFGEFIRGFFNNLSKVCHEKID
jgi:hypothetical protein